MVENITLRIAIRVEVLDGLEWSIFTISTPDYPVPSEWITSRYWKPQKIWSGSSQLAEACRIYSSLVPAWRWMNIDNSTMMLLSSSGRRCAEDQSITVETLGGFSSPFKLAPENCITCRRFPITTWKRLEWLGWWVTPTISWCDKGLSGYVETRYVGFTEDISQVNQR